MRKRTDCIAKLTLAFLPAVSLLAQDSNVAAPEDVASVQMQSKSAPNSACAANSHAPYRVSFKHREAKGIGYRHGYSTVEAFLGGMNNEVFPFLDLRGHVFNNGYLASNLGVGLRRYFSPSKPIFGANLYYDYRHEHHSNFHQIGAGLEGLWNKWSGRINGYFPVGKNNYVVSGPSFSYFSGHNAFFNQRKRFSFIGFNAEVSNRFWERGDYSFDAYASFYYLNGKYSKNAPGGMLRVVGNLTQYVSLEALTSYDPVFKWIGQGSIAINIPFGPSVDLPGEWSGCRKKNGMENRIAERVQRFEIIPTKSKKITETFLDAGTGNPYYFVFVDNVRGSSDGSYEHPYPTLLEAQNNSTTGDILYVFSGDGTSTGMNAGITLQDYQQLLGSGVSQYLTTTNGYLEIPAQSSALPLITNTNPANGVINLANYNVVSGVHGQLPTPGSGNIIILGESINSATITHCIIDGETYGILIFDSPGSFVFDQNSFINSEGINLFVTGNTSSPTFAARHIITNNTFEMVDGELTAIDIVTFNSQTITTTISGNSIDNSQGTVFPLFGAINLSPRMTSTIAANVNNNFINAPSIGVAIQNSNAGSFTGTISNNTIQNGNSDGIYVFRSDSSTSTSANIDIANNIISNSNVGIHLNAADTYNVVARVFGNDLTGNASQDFLAEQSGTGTICLDLNSNRTSNGFSLTQTDTGTFDLAPTHNNIGTISTSGTITDVPPGTCAQ